jgi:hypothetical protein
MPMPAKSLGVDLRVVDHLGHRHQHAGHDLARVVLDPARLRKDLKSA